MWWSTCLRTGARCQSLEFPNNNLDWRLGHLHTLRPLYALTPFLGLTFLFVHVLTLLGVGGLTLLLVGGLALLVLLTAVACGLLHSLESAGGLSWRPVV